MTNNQITSIVQRIERLEDEKSQIAEDIKDVYTEAKGNGFDPKIIRKVVALRKMDAAKRLEEQALIATYMDALGMLADTPLGQAALKNLKAKPKSDEEDFV
jgi:uncharacterized protein (UPF0335 family)